jgi:hypothetical protein
VGVLRSVEEDEYQPVYSLLVVRDVGRRVQPRSVGELLEEHATNVKSCGSIARAGDGWLEAAASSEYQAVRLEAHDSPPAADHGDWADVVETPYASMGEVGLMLLTWSPVANPLELGPSGLYRVRVARRPAREGEGDVWRLQFWPVAAPPEAPRWFVRSQPFLGKPGSAATDLVSLVLWAQEGDTAITAGWLADRLLATPDEVRQAIEYAAQGGLLDLTGEPGDPLAALTLSVRQRRARPGRVHQPAPPGPPWRHQPAPSGPPRRFQPPTGAPPRAGFVSPGGEVVAWRDGQAVILGGQASRLVRRALETAYGVALVGEEETTLVRPDGQVDRFGGPSRYPAAVDESGRLFAFVEFRSGRRAWTRLHLIDLADGSRQTLPWDETDHFLEVIAVRGGVVSFAQRSHGDRTMQWVPGSEPQTLPYRLRRLDASTGTAVGFKGDGELLLIRPDGSSQRLDADPTVTLAPGARFLYTFRYDPPAILVSDVDGPVAPPRTFALPPGSRTDMAPWGRPVWEDPEHVVLMVEQWWQVGAPAIRLNVCTGAFEAVPLPPEARNGPVLVEPLLARAMPGAGARSPRA